MKYQNNLIYSESYVYNLSTAESSQIEDFGGAKKGFITVKTVINGNTTDIYNYIYDNLGRLTEVIKNDATVESYSFDSNGNRISEAFFTEYDNQDRMTRYKDNLYDYTQRGSLREKTTANGTTLYNYDVIGNLRGVTLEDGTVIDYVIDGRNRRIAKKVNGVTVQKFLYLNQLEPIAELDGNDNLVSLFVYGSKGNVPEYIIKSGVAYKVIANQLGSVVKVINAYGGTVQQEIEYDSFGNILSDSNPTFQPFRLAGGLYDVDTKLIRFGARDYDSETSRWTSKDPIKFDGGRNFYVYGENNPVMMVDWDGMDALDGINGVSSFEPILSSYRILIKQNFKPFISKNPLEVIKNAKDQLLCYANDSKDKKELSIVIKENKGDYYAMIEFLRVGTAYSVLGGGGHRSSKLLHFHVIDGKVGQNKYNADMFSSEDVINLLFESQADESYIVNPKGDLFLMERNSFSNALIIGNAVGFGFIGKKIE